jgi:hypothetical protein
MLGALTGYQVRKYHIRYSYIKANPESPEADELRARLEKYKRWLQQTTDRMKHDIEFDKIIKANEFDGH